MSLRFTFILILGLTLPVLGRAQDKKWSLGIEFNPNIDQANLFDAGHLVNQRTLYSLSTGIIVQREINSQLWLQTGALFKLGRNEILISPNPRTNTGAIEELYLFNLPLRLEFAPWKKSHKLPLFFRLGTQLVFQHDALYGPGYGWAFVQSDNNTSFLHYTTANPCVLSSLWEMGLGFDFPLNDKWSISTSINWLSGRYKISEIAMTYQVDNAESRVALSNYTGNHISFGFQLKRRSF